MKKEDYIKEINDAAVEGLSVDDKLTAKQLEFIHKGLNAGGDSATIEALQEALKEQAERIAELEAGGQKKALKIVKYSGKDAELKGKEFILKGKGMKMRHPESGEVRVFTADEIVKDKDLANHLIECGSLPERVKPSKK